MAIKATQTYGNRVNIGGVQFELGKAVPVSADLGLQLSTDIRFTVTGLDEIDSTPRPSVKFVRFNEDGQPLGLDGSPLSLGGGATTNYALEAGGNLEAVATAAAGKTVSGAALSALSALASIDTNGMSSVGVNVSGSFNGTVSFEGTVDGTHWVTLNGVPVGAGVGTGQVNAAPYPLSVVLPCSGLTKVRARMTDYTNGTANVTFHAVDGSNVSFVALLGSPLLSLSGGGSLVGDVGLQYRSNYAAGAAQICDIHSQASAGAFVVKEGAGKLVGWQLTNLASTPRFVKLYNTSNPSIGFSYAQFEIAIPAGKSVDMPLGVGIGFSSAIYYSISAAAGLNDATATGLASNDVVGALFFA